MRRYYDLAVTVLAGIVAVPIALWLTSIIVLVALMVGLFVLMLLLLLVHHVAGEAGVSVAMLGIIAATAYGIYKLIEDVRA